MEECTFKKQTRNGENWLERAKKLLQAIEKKGYITPQEAKKILKICDSSFSKTRYMIPEIKEIRFTRGGPRGSIKTSPYKMFNDCALQRIWYLDENHPGLITFIANSLPSNLSSNVRKTITRNLRRQRLSLKTIHKIYIHKNQEKIIKKSN